MSLSIHTQQNDVKHLKDCLRQKGCFESNGNFYTYYSTIIVSFLILNIGFLLFFDNFLLQILNAICLAFVFGQIGLLAHDIVHRQVWKNVVSDMILGNLFLGISYSWWHDKHNKKHHRYTNQPGLDEDIEAPLMAFTQEQANKKEGLEKSIIRYQIYYLPLLFMFIPFYMYIESIYFLVSKKVKYKTLEIILLITHLALFLSFLLISPLSINQAIIFFLISKGVFGLYIGSIFIVNHTGMPILDKSNEIDYFSSQVITSRNIKAHPLTDFMMGGLNAQIEHHLFPQMPRPNLRKSRDIVKDFCNDNTIPYHEIGLLQSVQEVLTYLNSIDKLSGAKVNVEGRDG